MKKFYTAVLSLIALLGISFSAKAADITFTLNVDRANAVELRIGWGGEWEMLEEGDNVFTTDPGDWGTYYYIRPADGYMLDQVVSADPASYSDIDIYDKLGSNYLDVEYNWDGRKYSITTKSMDEMRTASCTINVTGDLSKISKLTRYNDTQVTLKEGENVVKFDPESESPFTLDCTEMLRKVAVNGDELHPSSPYYRLYVTDGAVVDIETEWPDTYTNVTINVPEGMESVVTRVRDDAYPYDPIDFKLNEAFPVKCGKKVEVTVDNQNYTITSAVINGVEQSVYSTSFSFFVGEEDIDVTINCQVKERFYVVFEIDGDDKAEVAVDEYGYYYNPLVAGENKIFPTESPYGYGYYDVKIRTKSGYQLVAIKSADPSSYDDITVSGNSATYEPYSYHIGRKWTIETKSLDDLRTGELKVILNDDPTGLRLQYKTYDNVTLKQGENTVKFDPSSELPLRVYRTASGPIYKIQLNGEDVAPDDYGYYYVTPAESGDVLEITNNYPEDMMTEVTITGSEDAVASIKEMYYISPSYDYIYVDLTNVKVDEPFYVKAGKSYSISFYRDDYNIVSASVNGVKDSSPQYGIKFFAGEEPVEVNINAHKYGNLTFTVNINDPEGVTLKNYSTYQVMALTGTETVLELPERENKITIDKKMGYRLISVTDGNGNELDTDYSGAYTVTDGMVINIVVEKIEMDGKFVVWFDTFETLSSYMGKPYWRCEESSDIRVDFDKAGYTVVPFSTAIAQDYQHVVKGWLESDYLVKAYHNGEALSSSTTPSLSSWYGYDYEISLNPQHLDVVRVYSLGDDNKYDVQFHTYGGGDQAEVTTDVIVPQENFVDGLNLLNRTLVEIKAPEGATAFSAKVDGNDLTPDENGVYSFEVTGPHEVDLDATLSAINNVSAEKVVKDGAVYNMLGVKVADNATQLSKLPAGVYIVNGVKKVVK